MMSILMMKVMILMLLMMMMIVLVVVVMMMMMMMTMVILSVCIVLMFMLFLILGMILNRPYLFIVEVMAKRRAAKEMKARADKRAANNGDNASTTYPTPTIHTHTHLSHPPYMNTRRSTRSTYEHRHTLS